MDSNELMEEIRSVSPFLKDLYFKPIIGNALSYNVAVSQNNHEDYFENRTSSLEVFIGQVEINNLIEVVSREKFDLVKKVTESKARGIGRKFLDVLINGNESVEGLVDLVPKENTTIFKEGLSKKALDNLLLKNPDFILMNSREYFKAKADKLLTGFNEYKGVPIYRIDFINTEPNNWLEKVHKWLYGKFKFIKHRNYGQTTLYSGKFDDGSMSVGVSGLMFQGDNPLLKYIGQAENRDAEIYLVKFYGGFVSFDDTLLTAVKVKTKG